MTAVDQRRIAALAHANARRTREIDGWRGELATRLDERNALLARRAAKCEQIDGEAQIIAGQQARIDRMTSDGDGFSIESFNQCVRYIGVVSDRKRAMTAELDKLDGELERAESAISKLERQIATAMQKIERCDERIAAIRRARDSAREDAQDEENEEMATSRFIRRRALQG
ncbi:type III secretion protein HrpB7 [Burkholderia lata]|uniref:Type III secretion protein HrpB7 n=1 Tax=Burkholderia lata (strain ATCC 17760 / DSM 23089 / LMG 22485 / NCIMB 9086 / R18194 / 383) TaxID=482957 RepID=A0A6P2S117_BURL3|nr:type III secretion protein HrpB7 [Burkholderia lata]